MNCTYHVGVELVRLPQAKHRHFQSATADPDVPADSARVDLRCPISGCPCVASELTSRANKKDCLRKLETQRLRRARVRLPSCFGCGVKHDLRPIERNVPGPNGREVSRKVPWCGKC